MSQGSPSEEGFYMDARAGIDYLSTRTDINTNEIIVFGRSLGNEHQVLLYKFKLESIILNIRTCIFIIYYTMLSVK